MKTNSKRVRLFLAAALMALLIFGATSCGDNNSSSYIPYDESASSESVVETENAYNTGRDSETDAASDDIDFYYSNNHTTKNTENYYYENNNEYVSYNVTEESTQVDCTEPESARPSDTSDKEATDFESNLPVSEAPENADSDLETNYESSNPESTGTETLSSVESDHDYAEEADIRTNEVCFNVRYPKVGATEAVIRTEFTNYRDSEITMAGCTVYDAMGKVIGTNYGSSSYNEETGFMEFDLKNDMGIVLERGETYYYSFVVESGGDLFTHKQMSFKTNAVDDRFAFELQDVKMSEDNDTVTISAKVYNSTGAHVSSVGYYAATVQGAHVADETITVDTSDDEFLVSFEISGFRDETLFGPDYDYTITVNYEGEKYTSYMGYFSVPK